MARNGREEKMARGRLYSTLARQADFLYALLECKGIVKDACIMSNVPERTAYRWLRNDIQFQQESNSVFREVYETILLDKAGEYLTRRLLCKSP